MPARFEYDHVTPDIFRDRLAALEMEPYTFARLFGVRTRTIDAWLAGLKDIPPWVCPVLAMLSAPRALGLVRSAAAGMIRRDNLRPELLYPYLLSRKEAA